MNLAEIGQTVQKKIAEIPETYTKVAAQGENVRQTLAQIHAQASVAEDQMRTELARIPVAVDTARNALLESQRKVLTGIENAEHDLGQLRQLVETAQQDLHAALSDVQTQSDELSSALPDAKNKIANRVAEQLAQLASDQKAEVALQETLRDSLSLATATLRRLIEQSDSVQADVKLQMAALSDGLAAVPPVLLRSRENLAETAREENKEHRNQLQDTQTSIVQANADRIAAQVQSDLQERVMKPAAAAVQALDDKLDATARQMAKHEEELRQQIREPLQKNMAQMATDPRAKEMVKAGKEVLLKVGKLRPDLRALIQAL